MVDNYFTGVSESHNKDDDGNITRKYVGDYLNGLEHGIGVYEARFNNWENKNIATHRFAGQFIEGKCSGLGVKTYNENYYKKTEMYCGEFKNDLRNGIGYWKLPTGAIFNGEFKDHLPDGMGALYSSNGYIYIGAVKYWNALPNAGIWVDKNYNIIDITELGYYFDGTKYVGDNLGDIDDDDTGKRPCPHGEGRWDFNTGEYYVGSWANGKRHGYGEMLYSDLAVYKGQWTYNRRNGSGVETFANGIEFRGLFKDDFGYEGQFHYPDGKIREMKDGLLI